MERDGLKSKGEIFPGFEAFFVDGHTESQMLPLITYKNKKLLYAADLLPSTAHIPLPYVMGYDVRPLSTLKEKEIILNWIVDNSATVFFEHDIDCECATLKNTEKGIRVDSTFKFSEY